MNALFNNWYNNKINENKIFNNISEEDICLFINSTKNLLFPGIDERVDDLKEYLDSKLSDIKFSLIRLLTSIEKMENMVIDKNYIVKEYLNSLPEVDELIKTDIEAIYQGDPACRSTNEVILCYPGFLAIYTYRIAHVLYTLHVKILPRIISEYAHSITGIDIHPGAKIKSHFFIDHGTGIVIGETCEIGENVKVYQGVTLGALSLREGQALRGVKRHPTIMDNVTIYSGASIFGGETVIGKNSTIGSNAFITSSVEDNSLVTIKGQKQKIKE
ncbi:MAG: hypothetical protein IJR67_03300 [Acholeplasmatales bacterium]|nr:hypothetical protein [Acholeplasmatales bacterium]